MAAASSGPSMYRVVGSVSARSSGIDDDEDEDEDEDEDASIG
jgi:hypothetical protein